MGPGRYLASVVETIRVAPGTCRLTLVRAGAGDYAPGQFAMVRAWPSSGPLLRRPFSIMDARPLENGELGFDLLYQVVGRGTALMERLEPGMAVDCLGPLGEGFPLPARSGFSGRRALCVAGGLGVAPFPLLVRKLVAQGVETHVVVGGRTQEAVLLVPELLSLGAHTIPISEAGDLDRRGYATDAMEEEMDASRPDVVYSCGPEAMLSRVVEIASRRGVPCFVSLERRMPCGFGICFGCVVKARTQGYKEPHNVRSCLDGPVLDASRLAGLDWTVR